MRQNQQSMLVVVLFNLNQTTLTFFSVLRASRKKKVPVDGFMGILGLPSQRYEQGHPGAKTGAWCLVSY